MSAEQPMRRATRPKGIVGLVLLFYAGAALVVLAAIIGGDSFIPADITSLITIYFLVLAWGLWRLYRWAWFATIIMFVLSCMFTLSKGLQAGNPLFSIPVGVPIITSLAALVYLLGEPVRRVFMANGWVPARPSAPSEADE